MLSLGFEPRF